MKYLLYAVALLPLVSLNAYEACAKTKQEALENLSGSIITKVETDTVITANSSSNGDDESIEERINSISKSSTKLSLVKISFEKRDGLICASIDSKDQIQNTHDLIKSALNLNEKNLPENIDKKIEKLSEWLAKIKEVGYLRAVFYKPKDGDLSKVEVQKQLEKKEKTFQDIYDKSIAKANSLIFIACGSSKEDAFKELNDELFADKTKKKDDEGFFGKTGSFFGSLFSSKDESLILDMFKKQIIYKKQDNKECAIIKKDVLLRTAESLLTNVKNFDIKSLSKLPKKRYDEIINRQEHLNVTKALLEVFPNKFNKNDFAQITSQKQKLANILKETDPQYVMFTISGATNIKVILDDKPVKINEKIYLKTGEHTYTITADGKCPITESFETELKNDNEINKNLTEFDYPTVLFVTDKTPNISILGKIVKPNVPETLKECKGSVRYLANFSGQTKSGEIEVSPNLKETVELKFLTKKELEIFNNASTKKFTTTSKEKISQSLTPLSSASLKFSLEDKPEHGELELHEAGSFTYVSEEGFVGRDSFSYIVEANGEESAPKIVNILVNESNAPVAKVKELIKDVNETINVVKDVTTKEEEEQPKEEELSEERIMKFQIYLEKLAEEGDIEKMKKIQAKYPKEFEAVLKRKLNN